MNAMTNLVGWISAAHPPMPQNTPHVRPGYKQTEVGVIPVDWACRTLQSLTDLARPIGYGIVQTGKTMHNGVKCLRVVDMVDGRIDPEQLITTSDAISLAYKRTLLRKNDLVIALRGKIGAVAVIGEELAGANLTRGVALLSASEDFHSGYLSQYLSSSTGKNTIEKNLNGSALQEIPIAALRKIPVVVPPLPEQRAIATALSDVDALLAAQDKLIAKKRDIKQAAMQQLLTGKQRLPGFSGEWEVKQLGDVAEIRKGQLITEKDAVAGNVPVIAGGKKPAYYHNKPNRTGKTITVSASGASAGYVAIFDMPIFASDCSTISKGLTYSIEFVYFQLLLNQEVIYRAQTGGAQPHIHAVDLMPLEVGNPSMAEQTAIAAVLSDMDADLAALEQQRDKTRALKQGMMQELLTGRIRLV